VSREELIQMIADWHIFKGVVPDESWYEDLANDIEAEIKKAYNEGYNDGFLDCENETSDNTEGE